jgi:uncharacterized protein (DUF427 family)
MSIDLPEESVWDYPRPPRLEPCPVPIRVEVDGLVLAESHRALRVLETSHPPTIYVPPQDVFLDRLEVVDRRTLCEWKGEATYFDLVAPGPRRSLVAWAYPAPVPAFAGLRDHLCFYPSRVDACWLGALRVQAQEGDFYGGWITPNLRGPFKGGPGTRGW